MGKTPPQVVDLGFDVQVTVGETKLGNYTLREHIPPDRRSTSVGFGHIFRVDDPSENQMVAGESVPISRAAKILGPRYKDKAAEFERVNKLYDEPLRSAQRPTFQRVIDTGEYKGLSYCIMPWRQMNLLQYMDKIFGNMNREQRRKVREDDKWIRQALEILINVAHDVKIAHELEFPEPAKVQTIGGEISVKNLFMKDLKPENYLIDQDAQGDVALVTLTDMFLFDPTLSARHPDFLPRNHFEVGYLERPFQWNDVYQVAKLAQLLFTGSSGPNVNLASFNTHDLAKPIWSIIRDNWNPDEYEGGKSPSELNTSHELYERFKEVIENSKYEIEEDTQPEFNGYFRVVTPSRKLTTVYQNTTFPEPAELRQDSSGVYLIDLAATVTHTVENPEDLDAKRKTITDTVKRQLQDRKLGDERLAIAKVALEYAEADYQHLATIDAKVAESRDNAGAKIAAVTAEYKPHLTGCETTSESIKEKQKGLLEFQKLIHTEFPELRPTEEAKTQGGQND